MTLTAFILIVTSAAFHATWNLLAKKNHITIPYYTLISSTTAILWSWMLFVTPIRITGLPAEFWSCMICSLAADILYCVGLVLSYRRMEMATAYPAMRALPIVLTAIVTTAAGLGSPLSGFAVAGFAIVFIGSMLMPLDRFADFKWSNYLNRNIAFILLTACGTTGYTIFDSQCQQIIRDSFPEVPGITRAISYYSLRALSLASSLWIVVALHPASRRALQDLWRERNRTPFLAGLFAGCTYVLVLLAMNHVDNVSYVQVFRQLGLPIGMAAGVLILKEHCRKVKLLGITLILIGLALSVLKPAATPAAVPKPQDPVPVRDGSPIHPQAR